MQNANMKNVIGPTKNITIDQIAYNFMLKYGTEVNEGRALPDFRDGFKPVQRRILWAAYKDGLYPTKPMVKSAKVIGSTLGGYHPHGDMACYGAMATMVNDIAPFLDRGGNWGSLSDSRVSAYRYTMTRLTKLAMSLAFDPFYMPMMKMVPNYDDSSMEPLYIPILFPMLLVNGSSGIGVGTVTGIPSYTPQSLALLIKKGLQTEITPAMCMKLEFSTTYGGKAVRTTSEWKRFYTEGIGSVTFVSTYKLEEGKWHGATARMVFRNFAPVSDLSKVIQNVMNIQGVVRAVDESEPDEMPGTICVYLKGTEIGRDVIEAKVVKCMSSKVPLRMNITERGITKTGKPSIKFRATTVAAMLNDWIKWRVQLEVDACTHQSSLLTIEMRRLAVLKLAVINRAIILQALSKDYTDDQLKSFLASKLKISIEEANMILEMKVRQLRNLEGKALDERMKSAQAQMKTLQIRIRKPDDFISTQLDGLVGNFTRSK